jgi:hypothetical protein
MARTPRLFEQLAGRAQQILGVFGFEGAAQHVQPRVCGCAVLRKPLEGVTPYLS